MDALHSLLILLSITLLNEERIAWSWVSMTLATQMKPQAYIFFPLVLTLTIRKFGWRSVMKGSLAALATFLVIISPFLYHGTTLSLLRTYFMTVAPQSYLSLNAHNLWWLLSGGNGWINDTEIPRLLSSLGVTFLTYRTIGLLLLGAFTLLALYRLYHNQHGDTVYMTAAFLGFIFFMLPTQMHENYMFAVLPLLCVASSTDRKLTLIYAILSLTFFSNMVLHDPAILDWLRSRVAEQGLFIARWANAGLNFALLAFWSTIFLWPRQRLSSDKALSGEDGNTPGLSSARRE
jgi:Gpi18-like mannosyltransferase